MDFISRARWGRANPYLATHYLWAYRNGSYIISLVLTSVAVRPPNKKLLQ